MGVGVGIGIGVVSAAAGRGEVGRAGKGGVSWVYFEDLV